jgi:hypothetical protein
MKSRSHYSGVRTLLRGTLPVAAFMLMCACTKPAPPPTATATTQEAASASHHVHTAPHGGTLIELGEEFGHVELVVDQAAGRITAYILDGEAEQAVRLKQESLGLLLRAPARIAARPFELRAVASVMTGETIGDSAEFVLLHESFKGVSSFEGVIIAIDMKGTTFRDVPVKYPAGDHTP